jgi:hypothetical protein
VNRFKSRRSAVTVALAACGLAVAALSGCSAGQVSQTASQQAAVNGAAATVGSISLRNVHIRAPQSGDYVQPGSEVELLFVASNESPDRPDKLTSITSDAGTVTLSGDTSLPPGGVLVVGEPDGQIAALEQAETAAAAKATVTINSPSPSKRRARSPSRCRSRRARRGAATRPATRPTKRAATRAVTTKDLP